MPNLQQFQLQQFLDAAFHSAPARDANLEIASVRDQHEEQTGGAAWSYEVLLPEVSAVEYLVEEMLPRLTYFLHSRGTPLGGDLFLSIFTPAQAPSEGRLYFLTVPDALAILSQWSGLSLEDMKRRWADGFGAPPLMLPGPQK